MPGFHHLIEDALLAAAARTTDTELVMRMQHPTETLECPQPNTVTDGAPGDEALHLRNPIWHWELDPAQPQLVRNATVRNRGMGMRYGPMAVFDRIEFKNPIVRLLGKGDLELPLTQDFLSAKFFLPEGHIPAADSGLWQLEANTDPSYLYAFSYQLTESGLAPISAVESVRLRDEWVPRPGQLRRLSFVVRGHQRVTAVVDRPRFLVLLGVTFCKERNDCEPTESFGAARVLPHLMLVSNVDVPFVQATIELARPAKTHRHGPDADEMEDDIHAVLFTDTNDDTFIKWSEVPLPLQPAAYPPVVLPFWDDIFDYYELEPRRTFEGRQPPAGAAPGLEPGEVCMVDQFAEARTIRRAKRKSVRHRNGFFDLFKTTDELVSNYHGDWLDIVKLKGQGEFDSLHLAPRMRTNAETQGGIVRFDKITMAPFCVHDCLHTHTRWGQLPLPPGLRLPKSNRGFGPSGPYASVGAPMVPLNQSVFLSLPAEHTFRYRAVATDCRAGEWQVFNHHGSYYIIDAWPTFVAGAQRLAAQFGVQNKVAYFNEPYTSQQHGALPRDSFAAMYWRLRFGGIQEAFDASMNHVIERLQFDLLRALQ